MKRVVALWGSVIVLTVAGSTRAQPAPDGPQPQPSAETAPMDEAREHHRRGLELYDEGDFRLALVEFERAYATAPSYKLLYNIGQVHFQLMHYAKARTSLEQFLREGGDAIPPQRRADVERDLATLRGRTATLSVRTNAPDAEVFINDMPVGKAPIESILVDAGPLRVQVSSTNRAPRMRNVTLAGGDRQTVTIELGGLEADARTMVVPAESRSPSAATIGWIATGVLGASAVGMGIAALVTSSRYNVDRKAPIKGTPEEAFDELAAERGTLQKLSVATDILIGATLVAGGVSLYLTLRDKSRTQAPHVRAQGTSVVFAVGF